MSPGDGADQNGETAYLHMMIGTPWSICPSIASDVKNVAVNLYTSNSLIEFVQGLGQAVGSPYCEVHGSCLIFPIEHLEVRFREQAPLAFLYHVHTCVSETAAKRTKQTGIIMTHRQVRLHSRPLAIILPQ